MRLVYLVFMVFFIIGFSGCSSKSIEKPQEVLLSEKVDNSVSASDDEFEEFEEEMKAEEIYDPFSGYNRAMTSFNDGVYEHVFKPIAKGYKFVLHKEIRLSIRNFFHNLDFPMRLVNNLLQGKFHNSYEETQRFILNSTVGLLGLFDPAKSEFEIQSHEEDFGQTLGFYGVGAGPHIVLPLFGPSNFRDTISMYPDSLLSPIDSGISSERKEYVVALSDFEYFSIKSLEKINSTSLSMDDYEKLKEDAVDLYPYLRDVYEQYRNKQIEE
ncbi:MAG: VacJ family lipoprotein [Sulfurimonas sp.]|nr:VacJ family lipoprotein [Sulfurimonas sp.]